MSRTITIITTLSLFILAVAVLGGMVWGNTLHAARSPGEKDFLVPWLAARTFLDYGDSPYGESAAQRAQIIYYGRLAAGTEDPLYLWIPFPAELFYMPFALIQDYELARGLWMTLSELGLVAAIYLILRLIGWKPSRFLLPLVFLFPLTWAFGMFNLFSANPASFTFLSFAAMLTFMRSNEDELAGIMLLFPLMSVNTFGVFLAFFLWYVFHKRRWRILAGLGMALGVLLLLSFLLLPGWLLPFGRGLYQHQLYNPGFSSWSVLGSIWPVVGPRLGWLLAACLFILLVVEWRSVRHGAWRHFLWTVGLTLGISPLMGLPFQLFHLTALAFPIFLFISVLVDRWRNKFGEWPGLVALLLIFGGSWGLVSALDRIDLILVIPVILWIALYWMRWWTVRPPRTSLESLQ